ncbi:hypothetical protein K431DRAFT_296514 [Polychaeton citri CBS 116435]|uniref:Uncharacterized protein n=1 Tax=Polychaeton citri CBS 116435 TaxID=1314669 RepID=A0A9P4Q5V9_9PEZI|nr:hypothetical protein K431DRAFT_296514 [Polychaeton citri CBS 116435]
MHKFRKLRRPTKTQTSSEADVAASVIKKREFRLTQAGKRVAITKGAPSLLPAVGTDNATDVGVECNRSGSPTQVCEDMTWQQSLGTSGETHGKPSTSSSMDVLRSHIMNDARSIPAAESQPTAKCDPVHPWPEPPEGYDSEPQTVRGPQDQQQRNTPKNVGLWIHTMYRAVVMVNRIDTSYARKAETAFWPFLARYMIRSEFELKMRQLDEQLDREQTHIDPKAEVQKGKVLAQVSKLLGHVHRSLKDEGSALEADEFQAALERFRRVGGFRFKPKPKPDPTDGEEEKAEIADRVGPGTYAGRRPREIFMQELGEELDDIDEQHELLSHPPFGDKDWGEVEALERRLKVWGKRKANEA